MLRSGRASRIATEAFLGKRGTLLAYPKVKAILLLDTTVGRGADHHRTPELAFDRTSDDKQIKGGRESVNPSGYKQ